MFEATRGGGGGVVSKKLKLSFCSKAKKPESSITIASTSKEDVVKCPACDEVYVHLPSKEWIQCCKCHSWWHEDSLNYEGGNFICDYC